MLIGYARVSTDDQDTAAQVAALTAAGCERIFREKASGGRWNRPQLLQLFTHLRAGDVVVVWKLDRLSRSLRDVLTLLAQLEDAGAGFRSVTEAIDTTTPPGRKGAWGAAAPRSPRTSKPRFARWCWKARRRPPPRRASSRSTPPPSLGCSRERPRGRRPTGPAPHNGRCGRTGRSRCASPPLACRRSADSDTRAAAGASEVPTAERGGAWAHHGQGGPLAGRYRHGAARPAPGPGPAEQDEPGRRPGG